MYIAVAQYMVLFSDIISLLEIEMHRFLLALTYEWLETLGAITNSNADASRIEVA